MYPVMLPIATIILYNKLLRIRVWLSRVAVTFSVDKCLADLVALDPLKYTDKSLGVTGVLFFQACLARLLHHIFIFMRSKFRCPSS